jgi:phosphatidate cytidylyltransferase
MEQALRNRLTLGPLMMLVLLGTLWLDAFVQRHTVSDSAPAGVGGVGIAMLLLLTLPLGAFELSKLFSAERVKPYRLLAVAGCTAMVLHGFFTQFAWFQPIAASTLAFIITTVMLLAALLRALTKQTHEAITHMAGTLLAVLYLGGLGWFLVALRVKQGNTLWDAPFHGSTWHIVMILLAVKFTDIGAFFTGRAIGRTKLIAWLSPGKTWEGLAGGLLTAAVVGALCAPQIVELTWYKGAAFGLLIGGVGQLGDLLESLFKRDADVKDSSSLIPGFGGVLDVIDSPLLAAPFAYLLFSLF